MDPRPSSAGFRDFIDRFFEKLSLGSLPPTSDPEGQNDQPKRPFCQALWKCLMITWGNLLALVLLGVACLFFWISPPIGNYFFTLSDLTANATPIFPETFPSLISIIMCLGIPILVFLAVQIKYRSSRDFLTAIIGLGYSILLPELFFTAIAWQTGVFRPNFLAVCRPTRYSISAYIASHPDMYPPGSPITARTLFTTGICTNENKSELLHAQQAMPSGHAASAFGSMVYLSLYMNAHLKIFAGGPVAGLKVILILTALLIAFFISWSRVNEGFHRWSHTLEGALLGITLAIVAYKMGYQSVWNWKTNDISRIRT